MVLFAVLNSTAQNIKGRVLELSDDGLESPVFGANVYWEGTTVGTITDIDGKYSIKEAPSFPASLKALSAFSNLVLAVHICFKTKQHKKMFARGLVKMAIVVRRFLFNTLSFMP